MYIYIWKRPPLPLEDEPPHLRPATTRWPVELRRKPGFELANASFFQEAVQVPPNGLWDGYLGNDTIAVWAQESLQVNVLSQRNQEYLAPSRPFFYLSPVVFPPPHGFRVGTRIYPFVWCHSPPIPSFCLYPLYRDVAACLDVSISHRREAFWAQWGCVEADWPKRNECPSEGCRSGSFRSAWGEGPAGVWLLFWCF